MTKNTVSRVEFKNTSKRERERVAAISEDEWYAARPRLMRGKDPTPEERYGTLRTSRNVVPQTLATALGAEVDPMEIAKEGYRKIARGEIEDPLLSRGAARAIGVALAGYQGLEAVAGAAGIGAPVRPVELVSKRNTAAGVPAAKRPVDATPEQRQAFDDAITARNKAKRQARSKGSTADRDAARHAAKLEARKAKPRVYVDPASVPEFSPSGETYAFGIRTYNVEDTEAGQLAVRRVIDAQLGKDRNPWCVIEYGPDGKLTAESKKLWKEYSHVQKQIAFNEAGEVIAFRANPPPVRGMLARRDRSGNWWTLDSNTALEPPEELFVGGDGVPVRLPDPEMPGRTRLVLIGSKEHPLTTFRGDYKVGREDVPFDTPITVQYERGVKRAFEPYELWDRRGQLKYRRTIKDGVAHSEVYNTYRDGRPPELIKTYDLRQATPAEKAALKQYDENWRKTNPGRNPDFDYSYFSMKPVFGDASEQDNIQGAYRYGIGGDGYINVGRSIWYSDGRPVEIHTYHPNGAVRLFYDIGSDGKVGDVRSYLPSEARREGESNIRFHYIRNRETGRLEKQEDAKGGNTRSASKGGDASGVPGASVPPSAPAQSGGPRIVINPQVFNDKRDALCVAFNEALRLVMEANGFEPVSEPTEKQRKFFADTAYADDELQLRRTILARIATLDTSVKDPTDEQLEETAEMLEMVMEVGAPQNEWEQSAVQRLHDMVVRMRESPRSPAPTERPKETGSAQAAEGAGVTMTGSELDFLRRRYERGASMSERQRALVEAANEQGVKRGESGFVNFSLDSPGNAQPAQPAQQPEGPVVKVTMTGSELDFLRRRYERGASMSERQRTLVESANAQGVKRGESGFVNFSLDSPGNAQAAQPAQPAQQPQEPVVKVTAAGGGMVDWNGNPTYGAGMRVPGRDELAVLRRRRDSGASLSKQQRRILELTDGNDLT